MPPLSHMKIKKTALSEMSYVQSPQPHRYRCQDPVARLLDKSKILLALGEGADVHSWTSVPGSLSRGPRSPQLHAKEDPR